MGTPESMRDAFTFWNGNPKLITEEFQFAHFFMKLGDYPYYEVGDTISLWIYHIGANVNTPAFVLNGAILLTKTVSLLFVASFF